MSGCVHDNVVRFRANGALVAAAAKRAQARGMSMSELMRSALRTAIASQARGEAE